MNHNLDATLVDVLKLFCSKPQLWAIQNIHTTQLVLIGNSEACLGAIFFSLKSHHLTL